MTIERRFTVAGQDPYDTVEWTRRTSRISNPDGSVVFEMEGAEIPSTWSQVAADIMVSKYFRKAGVPQFDEAGEPIVDEAGEPVTGPERSARQVISRLASTWRWWGETHDYFATPADGDAFQDEIAYMLLHQMAAPNSPQWFNTGLNHAYGITGPAQGFWYVDPDTEELTVSPDSYSRPAPHACFPAGTRITTRGGFLPIEKIAPGDDVLTHLGRYRTVVSTMQRQVDEDLVEIRIRKLSATPLVATANHPVWAMRNQGDMADTTPSWIPAGELKPGDYVVVGADTDPGNITAPSDLAVGLGANYVVDDNTITTCNSGHAPSMRRSPILRIDGQVAYRISTTTRVPFYGTVYNFQTDEDESYVAAGVVVHNCFIQAVGDDLVNEGGIMDLWVREARLFKFGSGTGTNFSHIRAEGESLSGGGKSSGLMSFLKVGDRAAGAIKSGGTTRRAAKMVILDIDHPDIETFINWKANEEDKVRALVAAGYDSDFNGEAYATVSGQNSNNSVRLSNEFVRAVLDDADWDLTARTDGRVMKTVKARHLWRQIAEAAWKCADPGVQYDTTIQEWHTSPAGGRIRATNPCSEYVFLDNTACNLASLNLVAFERPDGSFDLDGYRHAIRLWTMVLEISVTMAHFPSAEIAQGSYDYRTLGLGYANLGSLLMRAGIAYDSDESRAIAGALTAVLTGHAYATSAEMAEVLGPFPKFAENRDAMLRVMRNHRRAAHGADQEAFDGVSHHVVGIDQALCPPEMLEEAHTAWDLAVLLGDAHGYRNAQATVLAPTGTIGLLMDCDTTGVEPDFALVKFKKLAGGGYFKIANQSIAPALRRLGYDEHQVEQIIEYVVGTMSLHRAPHVNTATLIAKGLTADDIDKIEAVLPGVFELGFAFNQWTLGEETMRRLGFTSDQYNAPSFNMLKALGFSDSDIREANDYICGRQTIEGAPHLRDDDLPVFDTANKNGRLGQRFIHYSGHIKMMAAAQPFISGAISKTTNVPNEVTVDELEEIYRLSWELGLKAMALYRDGSKASQPLSAKSDEGVSDEEEEGLEDALATERELVTTGYPTIHAGMFRPGSSPSEAYRDLPRPRFLLPARRGGYTQEARVGGHKLFMRTGEYEDGTLGELFLDLAKEGATLRGILSCFAIAVSKGLQYGVPLEEFVDTFTFQTFEPRGMVEGHPNIKMANSMVDYVFRALGVEYLERDELAQVPPDRSAELPEPPKGIAVDAGVQLGLEEAAMESDIDAQLVAARFVDADDGHEDGSVTGIVGTAPATGPAPAAAPVAGRFASSADVQTAAIQQVLADKMGDAPLCDTCGHITVRNGGCYRCLNCGDSKGCS
ncbi:MAG: vitamin B12-dependent ribonucleotide reductase [Acidimicrobiia bacterium]